MKGKGLFFLLFNFVSVVLYAQQGITVAGGDASGSGGSVSYSVGQVSYTSFSGSGGSVSQGVQQTYTITTVGTDNIKDNTIIAMVYPNPTAGFIHLKVEGGKWNGISFRLFDLEGKLILDQKVIMSEIDVPMEALSAGSYFLTVIENEKEIKTFKIIKNN